MKKIAIKLFAAAAILSAITVVLLVCPLFDIKTVNISNNNYVTKQFILETLNLDKNLKNLFAFNTIEGKKKLLENSYIKNVSFQRKLPNILNIIITERKIRGYVPYMNSYLFIDDEGRIIDVKSSIEEKLPIVVGLSFKSFEVGKILQADNSDAFNVVVEFTKLMAKYEIIDDVVRIDVSNTDSIHLYINDIDVIFGNFDDYNWKISALNEILKKLPENSKGFLDISSSDKTPIFTLIT